MRTERACAGPGAVLRGWCRRRPVVRPQAEGASVRLEHNAPFCAGAEGRAARRRGV